VPSLIATLLHDLRFAVRLLGRSPGLTLVVVLSLALGIGANTAIFSLVDQVLRRPLPVPEPERLVNLRAPGPKQGWVSSGQPGSSEEVFSEPMFRDLAAAPGPWDGIAGHVPFGPNLAIDGRTTSAAGTFVSGSYFPVLGLQPALGRLLGPADDTLPGGHPVAVLSHRFWETQLAADPQVIERPMVVNGHPLTVVGVAPPGFSGTTLGHRTEVFVPLSMRETLVPGAHRADDRRAHWLYLFARLERGASHQQAHQALDLVYRPLLAEVEAPLQQGMTEETMARFLQREVLLAEGRRGQSTIHREARVPLLLLFGVTGMVLLIACANVANLLLARASLRQQELAMRSCLGAGRTRLLAQLLTESCLLALLGGAASLLVARWTLALLGRLLPAEAIGFLDLGLHGPALAFTMVVSLGTGLLFGIYPALQATRGDLASGARGAARQVSEPPAAARLRAALATGQIALATALLISAVLFVTSLVNIHRLDLGVAVDELATLTVRPELNGYSPEASRALFERLEEELSAIPGVTAVSAASMAILAGHWWGSNVTVEGVAAGPDRRIEVGRNEIGPGFFAALGIPLLAGRDLSRDDHAGMPRVAVVNEAFARRFGLEPREMVGRRMAIGEVDGELDIEIVGLVADSGYSDVTAGHPPLFFTPWRQNEATGGLAFYLRSAVDPARALASAPAVVRGLDPDLPVTDAMTLRQQARDNVTLERLLGILAAAFAAVAALLAALGLYGVLATSVARRTRELGLRQALGAGSAQLRGMVLGQVARMAIVGGMVGMVAALALGRAAGSWLHGVEGHDPRVLASGALLVMLVALAAGYLPARRATRVDPMTALRGE
jgi:predicted permease